MYIYAIFSGFSILELISLVELYPKKDAIRVVFANVKIKCPAQAVLIGIESCCNEY